jgi:hypothetical protein
LGVSFLVPLVVFKAPRIIRQQLSTDTFNPKNVVKSLFAKAPLNAENILLAQASGELETLEAQNLIDERAIQGLEVPAEISQSSAQQCLSAGNNWSEEELKEGLQEIKGGGLVEDVGRYIGF